jgi:hypothetical protein
MRDADPEHPQQTPAPPREPRWELPVPPETVQYPPALWQRLCIVVIIGWVVAVWFLWR